MTEFTQLSNGRSFRRLNESVAASMNEGPGYDTKAIMKATDQAYSKDKYGDTEWDKVARMLLKKGLDDKQVAAIMLSKHMRWSVDAEGEVGTAKGFAAYMKQNGKMFTGPEINKLVSTTFNESVESGGLVLAEDADIDDGEDLNEADQLTMRKIANLIGSAVAESAARGKNRAVGQLADLVASAPKEKWDKLVGQQPTVWKDMLGILEEMVDLRPGSNA